MAFIQKRLSSKGKTSYRTRIRVAGMPDKSATFSNFSDAKKWALKMESDIRGGRYFSREEDKEKTFGEFIDRYIEKELPKNPLSQKKQTALLSWWKQHLGKYFLCHISPPMIAELRDLLLQGQTRRKKLRTNSTTNRYLAALSRAFTIGIKEWGWLKDNPVLKITRPKENKGRERYLEKDEVDTLLTACRNSKTNFLYAIVLFSLATGSRKGEVLGLKWEDIDFTRERVTFRDTKNGENRIIPLSPTVLHCLQDERKKRLTPSEYIFPSQDGKKPADIRSAWENAVKEANLKDICFHSLRHTAASHLGMSGASTLEIAEILGHKTLAMVKRYSHLSTAATARTLNRMNDVIFK